VGGFSVIGKNISHYQLMEKFGGVMGVAYKQIAERNTARFFA
jgi:hypothetical protein